MTAISRCLLAIVLAAAVFGAAVPVGAEPGVRDHDIVLEDYFTLATATSCALSPDGSLVAYTEMRWDEEEDRRNTDLWVADMSTGQVTRLTFDPARDGSVHWSPDGRWIYFTSSRKRDDGDKPPYNGKTQVWRVAPTGGDLVAVTREADGIDDYELSHDGKTLYYMLGDEQFDEDDWKDLRKEFKKLEFGHGVHTFDQLWKLDLETWRTEKLVEENRVIGDFAVSPDESRIAMITRPDETLLTNEGWSRVDVFDAATGEITTLADRQWRAEAPSPYGWILGLGWAGDGEVLSFRVDFDGYPGEVFFAHFDAGDAPLIQKLNRPGEITVGGPMTWFPGTRDFCFTGEDFARVRVYRVAGIRDGKQGKAEALTPGDVCVNDYSFSADGKVLAALMTGLDHPPDVFRVTKPGARARFERVTRLNPQVDTWKIPSIQIVKWTSRDGTPVEGILELPPDYEEGEPLPLVLELHGGPTASTTYRFRFWIYGRTLMAAQGWALLSPNYRGSTGYGDEFLVGLIGHENDIEVADCLTGVDAMIERGIADPERMAVMGWSNGGYLTNAIITKDNRFKAASSGAGVFDMTMQWAIEDTPGHVINYMKGLPWEEPEETLESSPLYQVDRVTTPTVIHVGENDPRVPAAHSRALYRALRHYVKVPTELIVYPGAGHGLTKYTHRKAKMRWDTEWFNHHVLEKAAPEIPGSE